MEYDRRHSTLSDNFLLIMSVLSGAVSVVGILSGNESVEGNLSGAESIIGVLLGAESVVVILSWADSGVGLLLGIESGVGEFFTAESLVAGLSWAACVMASFTMVRNAVAGLSVCGELNLHVVAGRGQVPAAGKRVLDVGSAYWLAGDLVIIVALGKAKSM